MRRLSDEDCVREVDPLLRGLFRAIPDDDNVAAGASARLRHGLALDRFEAPFADGVPFRAVLATSIGLTDEETRAALRAARTAGETGLFVYNPARWLRLDPADQEEFRSARRQATNYQALREVMRRFAGRGEALPWWPARRFPLGGEADMEDFVGWCNDVVENEHFLSPGYVLVGENGRWGIHVTGGDRSFIGATQKAAGFLDRFCAELGTTPARLAEDYAASYEVSEWRRGRRLGIETGYSWIPAMLSHVYGPETARILLADPTDDDIGQLAEQRTMDSQQAHLAVCRYCRMVADEAAPGRVTADRFGVIAIDAHDANPRRVLILPRRHAHLVAPRLPAGQHYPVGALALGQEAYDRLLTLWLSLDGPLTDAFPQLGHFGMKWDAESTEQPDPHAHFYFVLFEPGHHPLQASRPGGFMAAYEAAEGPLLDATEQRAMAHRLREALRAGGLFA